MRCSGGKQVPAVKRARDRLERVGGVGELVRLGDPCPLDRRQQQAVVRADVESAFGVTQDESAPVTTDSRIDDGQMDTHRHVGQRVRQYQRPL